MKQFHHCVVSQKRGAPRSRVLLWLAGVGTFVLYQCSLVTIFFKLESERSSFEKQLEYFQKIVPWEQDRRGPNDNLPNSERPSFPRQTLSYGTQRDNLRDIADRIVGHAPPTVLQKPFEKLEFKLQKLHYATGKSQARNSTHAVKDPQEDRSLWEISDLLPPWMKEYFAWHREKHQQLTENKFETENHPSRFLVIQCSVGVPCGNLAERLLLLPYWLRVAYESNRLLFLHWTEPTALTHYLEPPMGGCDWRVPLWLKEQLNEETQGVLVHEVAELLSKGESLPQFREESIVRIQIKYTEQLEERFNAIEMDSAPMQHPTLDTIMHDVWRIFFVPSKHLIGQIRNTFIENHGMQVGKYVSMDLTALQLTGAKEIATNLVNCALVTSDSNPLLLVAKDLNLTSYLKSTTESPVFTRYESRSRRQRKAGKAKVLLQQTLMDFDAQNGPIHLVDSYHDIFVNLYLMSLGSCVFTYQGTVAASKKGASLSRLATLIGFDSGCYFEYSVDERCTAIGSSGALHSGNRNGVPIPDAIHIHFNSPMITDGANEVSSRKRPDVTPRKSTTQTQNAKSSNAFPGWLNEYLDWHRSTKSQITASNWNSTKYLILNCFESSNSCGGISDRLKPLPMIVWEAYQSRRLLLIWWDRPKALEEWLVPPSGGVDWTVPSFLKNEMLRSIPRLQKRGYLFTAQSWEQSKRLREGASSQVVLLCKIQSPDAGEKLFFDEQAIHAKSKGDGKLWSYKDIFHRLWREFFEPSPRLASILQSKFQELGLIPGRYAAAHLRAMYGNRDYRDPQEIADLTVLGINCASNLLPGSPVFFASDTSFAIDSAHAYQRLHQSDAPNMTIVSLEDNKGSKMDPIHLDKDREWKTRSPKAYDSTFIDLYTLAESRCVAYSNGGYGTFGSLLSHDPDCQMRFFKGQKKVKRCPWMNEYRDRLPLAAPNATTDVRTSSEWH